MPTTLKSELARIAKGDLFKWEAGKPTTGRFVGRPFALNYDRAFLLVADKWKQEARGLPQGAFLLAYYENVGPRVQSQTGDQPPAVQGITPGFQFPERLPADAQHSQDFVLGAIGQRRSRGGARSRGGHAPIPRSDASEGGKGGRRTREVRGHRVADPTPAPSECTRSDGSEDRPAWVSAGIARGAGDSGPLCPLPPDAGRNGRRRHPPARGWRRASYVRCYTENRPATAWKASCSCPGVKTRENRGFSGRCRAVVGFTVLRQLPQPPLPQAHRGRLRGAVLTRRDLSFAAAVAPPRTPTYGCAGGGGRAPSPRV
jgi:hypothetical protein